MKNTKSVFLILLIFFTFSYVVKPLASEAFTSTTSSTWLRTGPDTSFPSIVRIPRNSLVDVYGCIDGYRWCDVDYHGERGWLAGDKLHFVYNGRRCTLGSLAPFLGLMILQFSVQDYWGSHYQGRPWYNNSNQQRWKNWRPPPPVAPHNAPSRKPPYFPKSPMPSESSPFKPPHDNLNSQHKNGSGQHEPHRDRKVPKKKVCVAPEICN